MKLYTKEQVRQMLQVCEDRDLYEEILTFDDVLRTQTPIELPSNKEVLEASKNYANKWYSSSDELSDFLVGVSDNSFKNGIKWMQNKLLIFKLK